MQHGWFPPSTSCLRTRQRTPDKPPAPPGRWLFSWTAPGGLSMKTPAGGSTSWVAVVLHGPGGVDDDLTGIQEDLVKSPLTHLDVQAHVLAIFAVISHP